MKKFFKIGCLGLIALFALVVIILIVDISNDDEQAIEPKTEEKQEVEEETNESVEEEEPATEEPKEEEKPKTTEDIINEVVAKRFKSIDEINYVSDSQFVLIKAEGSENLTNNMTKKGIWMDVRDVLKDLNGVDDIEDIDFNILLPLTDQYGNTENGIVMKMSFDKETRNKINWDNFLIDNIPNVSKNYWEHPAFNK